MLKNSKKLNLISKVGGEVIRVLKIIVGAVLLSLMVNQPVYAYEDIQLSDEVIEYCEYYGAMYGISPELLESIIWNESRGDTKAQNGTCVGICQINTVVHKDRIKRITSINGTDSDSIYDVKLQIHLCADYINELSYVGYAEEQNDIALVLAWYHGEKKAKEKYESGYLSDYVESILTISRELEEEHGKI